MIFQNSSVLPLLITIPIWGAFFFWRNRQKERRLETIGQSQAIRTLSNLSRRKRTLKQILWTITVAALILSLANPAWGIDEGFIEAHGVAVIVALDVSASMNAQDLMPSRLEQAKLSIRQLYENQNDNLLGLILFAGTAFVQFPLTIDWSSAVAFLNSATTDAITQQGTALEDAIRLAMDTVDERIASTSVIIIMTDGENHEGNPILAAEEAAQTGIQIYAIGYGTSEGAPIPVMDEGGTVTGYKQDAAGNLVLSRLNDSVLEEITRITGGTYQRATASGIEIVSLLQEVARIESSILETRRTPRLIKRFELFVLFAFICLTIEMLLPETRKLEETS